MSFLPRKLVVFAHLCYERLTPTLCNQTKNQKLNIMAKKIFINLPVSDLKKEMEFYTKIGFTNNPTFTDDTAACMALSEEIYVMLLTH